MVVYFWECLRKWVLLLQRTIQIIHKHMKYFLHPHMTCFLWKCQTCLQGQLAPHLKRNLSYLRIFLFKASDKEKLNIEGEENLKDLGMQTAVSANFFTSFPVLSHFPSSTTQSTTAFTLKSTPFYSGKRCALTVDAVIALSKSFTRSSTWINCSWNFWAKIFTTLQRGWLIVPSKVKRRQRRNTSNIFQNTLFFLLWN